MKTTTLIEQAWTKAQGEVFTDAIGSDSWNYLLTLANYYIPRWATEYGVDWFSLYDPVYEVGKVKATDTYDLDTDDVRKLSEESEDYVRILHSDGQSYTTYTIVPPNQLQRYFNSRACAKVGANLKFSRKFVSTDPQFGGTIQAPIFGNPPLLVDEKSDVPVDNPAWLVCMLAYDVALHDILRKDTSSNLLSEANDIMKSMKADNATAQETRLSMVDLSFIGGGSSMGGGTSDPLGMNI